MIYCTHRTQMATNYLTRIYDRQAGGIPPVNSLLTRLGSAMTAVQRRTRVACGGRYCALGTSYVSGCYLGPGHGLVRAGSNGSSVFAPTAWGGGLHIQELRGVHRA